MRQSSRRVVLVLSVVLLAGALALGVWSGARDVHSQQGAPHSGHAAPQFAAYPGASYGLDPAGQAIAGGRR